MKVRYFNAFFALLIAETAYTLSHPAPNPHEARLQARAPPKKVQFAVDKRPLSPSPSPSFSSERSPKRSGRKRPVLNLGLDTRNLASRRKPHPQHVKDEAARRVAAAIAADQSRESISTRTRGRTEGQSNPQLARKQASSARRPAMHVAKDEEPKSPAPADAANGPSLPKKRLKIIPPRDIPPPQQSTAEAGRNLAPSTSPRASLDEANPDHAKRQASGPKSIVIPRNGQNGHSLPVKVQPGHWIVKGSSDDKSSSS